jgi:ribosomal-protein-alanine acetyltransferase
MNIRKATIDDLDRLHELEKLFLAPYTKQQIIYELTENETSVFLVIEDKNKILGFIDFWITFDSATICQLAVDEKYQHLGLATKLVEESIKILKNNKEEILWYTLEVREQNIKALNLYKKLGFVYVVTKPHYYSNGDNAIYMMKGLID